MRINLYIKLLSILVVLVQPYSVCGQGIQIFAQKIKLPDNIKLNLPVEARFDGTSSTDYFVNYSIENTSDDTLIDLNDSRLYCPRTVSRKVSEDSEIFTSELEFEASYVAKASSEHYSFNFVGDSLTGNSYYFGIQDSIVNLPVNWKDSLKGQSIINMWFICSVRIDSRGIPLEKRKFVEPIFIQTLGGILGVKKSYQPAIYSAQALILPSYSGFILQSCDYDEVILNNFNEAVKKRIVDKLKIAPFFATVYSDLSLPEDEIWLRRENKSSFVLGSPYFEISNYILRWKIYNYADQNGIKFHITHSLTTSAGINGTYSEPKIREFKKYQERINIIVDTAVKEVCNQFKLIYSNNKCKCN
jgi:hypothetical protein